jgi:hypothetical protein
MYQFGIGGMYGNPNGGNLATPTGPQRFGTIQDVSVEFDQKLVDLMGQNKFPDDTAPSDMKVSGKGGFGAIEVEIYNALFFADTVVTGSNQVSQDESYTVAAASAPAAWAASTTYTAGQLITDSNMNVQMCIVAGTSGSGSHPTWASEVGEDTIDGTATWINCGVPGAQFVKVANAATFLENLQVRYSNGSGALQPVASDPAAGEYTVAHGLYGFASGDVGNGILISYEYVTPSGAANQGVTLTVNNHLQGYGPTFELFLVMPYMGNNCLHLHRCRASKMSAPMKRDGYLISDFEFQAYPDASQIVFDWYQLGN